MGLWADWKEVRKKGKAAALRARGQKLGRKRRAIQVKQLALTNAAELLEGTCEICRQGPHAGEPILSGSELAEEQRRLHSSTPMPTVVA